MTRLAILIPVVGALLQSSAPPPRPAAVNLAALPGVSITDRRSEMSVFV